MKRSPSRNGVFLCTALLICAGAALAQVPTGNLFGTVSDEDGGPIAGATVTLSGFGATQTQVTDARGQFRFLALDPGRYNLQAELEGFSSIEFPDIDIRAGRNTTIPLVVQSAVQETITVTSESPLLDEREMSEGTTVTQIELEKIPTARDPWALLTQTPGVLVDRVNVGGSESGQQPVFRAPGVDPTQNDWVLDGIQINDMEAGGATTTYFDFDQFAEIRYTTGGTDVTKNTSGVSVNLVTKRGSNEFRGSARFYDTKAQGYFGGAMEQAEVNVGPEDMGPGQDIEDYVGAQIREIEDIGFEAGGAAIRDRLWLWGSWGQNDIQQTVPSGAPDDTILENASLKLNAQLARSNSFVASWNNGDKQKFGRGANFNRPPSTTWDQRGPSTYYRFEDTHVFASNLFLTGMFSIADLGFSVAAKGGVGPDAPESWRDSDGVWRDSFLSGKESDRANEFKIDGSYFFNAGRSNHELKVGGRYREYEASSEYFWPGRDIFTYSTTSTTFVVAKRGITTPVVMDYYSLWAQDTISLGRWTFNVGLRYDDQSGVNEAATIPANPMVPNVLPAIAFPGSGREFTWEDLVPRLGVTYAVGDDRDTLIRASFAQFVDQMRYPLVARTNPTSGAYAYFAVPPADGPYTGDGSELDDPSRVDYAYGFDPAAPTAVDNPNRTDPGLDAPITTEATVDLEHALVPEFVVGVGLTWRNVDGILEDRDLVRQADGTVRTLRADDYVFDGRRQGTIPGGISGGPERAYDVPVYALGSDFDFTGGSLLLNGSREREYLGGSLTFTKRLSNQWMMRGYFNVGEAEWRVPREYLENSNPNLDPSGEDRDGGTFLTGSGGSGRGLRFLQSTWAANLNGMYQVAPTRPWGFNIAGSFQAREGFPIPYSDNFATSTGENAEVSVIDDVSDYRLDDLYLLDLRVEKEFNLRGPMNMTFGIDAFNITNEGTELSRNRELSSSQAFWLYDNVSPRIYRLGVRLSWR